MTRRNIKHGLIWNKLVDSVTTKSVPMEKFLSMNPKPEVFFKDSIYYHIGDNQFALNGFIYGDEESHYG